MWARCKGVPLYLGRSYSRRQTSKPRSLDHIRSVKNLGNYGRDVSGTYISSPRFLRLKGPPGSQKAARWSEKEMIVSCRCLPTILIRRSIRF